MSVEHFLHPDDISAIDYYSPYLRDDGGESIWSRETPYVSTSVTVSQALRCNGFRCKRTGLVSDLVIFSGGTAAGATPSLVKIGAYHKLEDGSYNLIGASANTVSLFAITNNTYVVPFVVPWYKFRGDDYLIAVLIVTAAALPTLQGPFTTSANTTGTFLLPEPTKVGSILGQTDLPVNIAKGSLVSTSPGTFHGMLRP